MAVIASYKLTDTDFTHFIRGEKIGPIRVVREYETVLESWAGAQIRTYNHTYFYPSHIEYNMGMRGPANWGKSINRSNLIWAIDLDENGRGMEFISEKNPGRETVDGYMDVSEKRT